MAVKRAKRAVDLAEAIASLSPTEPPLRVALSKPPRGPMRHIDGGTVDYGVMLALKGLHIAAVAPLGGPELTVQIDGKQAWMGIPTVLLRYVADLIADSVTVQPREDSWTEVLVDDGSSVSAAEFVVWHWDEAGLVVPSY